MGYKVTYTKRFVSSGTFAIFFPFFCFLISPRAPQLYFSFFYLSMARLSAEGSSAIPEYMSHSIWRLVLEGDLV
jgi:hypothetical protein